MEELPDRFNSIEWGGWTGFNDLKAGVEHEFKSGYKIWASATADTIASESDAGSAFIVSWEVALLEPVSGSIALDASLIAAALILLFTF